MGSLATSNKKSINYKRRSPKINRTHMFTTTVLSPLLTPSQQSPRMKYGKSSCQATANHVHWTRYGPIPTNLLKTCIDCLLPSVTKIINASIETSLFPPQFKTASVAPVLKKPTLDKDELSNYRPVSNLPYLGKITEKVVVKQLKEYLKDHDLNQPLQSAYREFHSSRFCL